MIKLSRFLTRTILLVLVSIAIGFGAGALDVVFNADNHGQELKLRIPEQVEKEILPDPDRGSKPVEHRYNSNKLIVQADSAEDARRIAEENGLKIIREYDAISEVMGSWYGVMVKDVSTQNNSEYSMMEMAENLSKLPEIRYANVDCKYSTSVTPNDPDFSKLWGLHNTSADIDVDAPEAWDVSTGSSSVILADVDTGADYNHQDLNANMWRNPNEIAGNGVDDDKNGYVDDIYGINAIKNNGDPYDDNFHGSHTAGTMGACGNNGKGVAGVNWNVKIMALKFLDSGGNGDNSDAIECYNYMIAQKNKGQNIVAVNNSWNGSTNDKALSDAIEAAGKVGILSCCSAGNNKQDIDKTPSYPVSFTSAYIIGVLATDKNDQLANPGWGSNYGKVSVDLGAPGVSIYSCKPGNQYQYLDGTSMATPHVTGTVGLLAALFPNDTPAQRKARILDYVDPVSAISTYCATGGRLNVYKALQSAPSVVAQFSWVKKGNMAIDFTDKSTANRCTITGWNWDFGDGTSSTLQNPSHTYASSNWFNVKLTVTTDSPATDSRTTAVWPGPNFNPTANFSFTTSGGFTANFTDQSTDSDGTIAAWSWNFGDSTTSTVQNPSHTYQYPGTYTVTLSVADNEGGTASVTKDVVIPLSYCASSSFDANPVAISKVQVGTFSNSSGKSNYTDFMAKTINLNSGQSNTITVTMDSTTWNCYTRVWIDYNLNGVLGDSGELVLEKSGQGSVSGSFTVPSSALKNRKLGMRVSMREGSYRAVCAASEGWGEVEDYTVLIGTAANQPPTANFTFTTSGLVANFTDTSTDSDGTISSWAWNFGDNQTSTVKNPSHTYSAAGTYTVTLTVTDNGGATNSVSKQVTVSAQNQPPTANFTFTTSGLVANFTDTSTDSDGTISSWAWNFGDNQTSTVKNPSHTYSAAGTYTVTLTVTDNGGATNSVSKQVTVSSGGTLPTYCASSSSYTPTGYITNVVLGSFSNTSGEAKYTNFTNLTVNLTKGQTVAVSMKPYMNATFWNGYWRIWIDYNRDGDFNDAGEKVFEKYLNNQLSGQAITGSFVVPSSGVVLGQKTGMRISFKINSYRDVCSANDGWGEVEDYAVIVQ